MDQATGELIIAKESGGPNITFSGDNVLLNSVNVVSYIQNNFTDIQALQNIKVGKNTDATLKKITATEGIEIPSGKTVRFGSSKLYEAGGGQIRIDGEFYLKNNFNDGVLCS